MVRSEFQISSAQVELRLTEDGDFLDEPAEEPAPTPRAARRKSVPVMPQSLARKQRRQLWGPDCF